MPPVGDNLSSKSSVSVGISATVTVPKTVSSVYTSPTPTWKWGEAKSHSVLLSGSPLESRPTHSLCTGQFDYRGCSLIPTTRIAFWVSNNDRFIWNMRQWVGVILMHCRTMSGLKNLLQRQVSAVQRCPPYSMAVTGPYTHTTITKETVRPQASWILRNAKLPWPHLYD